MAAIHITRELLLGVHRGELPARLLTQVGLQHLLSLCPLCRREFERFRRDAAVRTKANAAIASAALGAEVARLEQMHRQARRDLRDLLKLPQEERAGRIKRSRSRFRGSHLALLLLEQSDRRLVKNV